MHEFIQILKESAQYINFSKGEGRCLEITINNILYFEKIGKVINRELGTESIRNSYVGGKIRSSIFLKTSLFLFDDSFDCIHLSFI